MKDSDNLKHYLEKYLDENIFYRVFTLQSFDSFVNDSLLEVDKAIIVPPTAQDIQQGMRKALLRKKKK